MRKNKKLTRRFRIGDKYTYVWFLPDNNYQGPKRVIVVTVSKKLLFFQLCSCSLARSNRCNSLHFIDKLCRILTI